MQDRETLSYLKYIVTYKELLEMLYVTILNTNRPEICKKVAREVFNGNPGILTSSDFWKCYRQYTDCKRELNIEQLLKNELVDIEKPEALIKKFCEELKKQVSEQAPKNTQPAQPIGYISKLQQLGYGLFDDRNDIAGKQKQKTNIINWLHRMYNEDIPKGGISSVNQVNRQLLEQNSIDYKTADIWNNKINKIHEDLKFRLFIKETDISFEVLIKLPLGLEQFDFTSDKAVTETKTLLGIFTNNDKSKGDTYSCSLIGSIAVKKIGYMFQMQDCNYDAVMFTLSKDLLKFKNSNFLVNDYIDACLGATNNFNGFRSDFCLGNKIVMGVTPGKLASVVLHPSAPNQLNGMLMSGSAGSGKSAFLDSVLVQALALDNKDYGRLPNGTSLSNQGNGAVVLLDAKSNEWVKPWKSIINQMGYVMYGFDGCQVDSSLLRFINKKGEVQNISAYFTEYMLGMCFLSCLRHIVRAKYGLIGAKDSVVYNNNAQDKLPRIVILADEINTISDNTKIKEYGKLYQKFLMANDTRTANYHWILAGQNLKASVISNKDQVNYPYRVLGSLDNSEYEYHGVKVDKAVAEYEAKTEKGSIMSQGMFYFGSKGNTQVIKSMYLPDKDNSERIRALKAIQGINGLMGLNELHSLVKWALESNPSMFKDNMVNDIYPRNNLVIASLYVTGAITAEEFEYYSSIVMGLGGDDSLDCDEPNQEVYGFSLNGGNQQSNQQGNQQSNQQGNQQRQDNQQSNQQRQGNQQSNGFNVNDVINAFEEQSTQEPLRNTNSMNDIDFSGFKVETVPNNSRIFDNNGNIDTSKIANENIVNASTINHRQAVKQNKIFEKSPIATKMYANKTFEDIIKSGIKHFRSKADIVHLTITYNEIWFNGQYIDCDIDNTSIKSIVSMGIINKHLKHLQLMEIDTSIMAVFIEELGDNAINEIFKINKKLQHLTIIKSDGSTIEIERDKLGSSPKKDEESKARNILNKKCNSSSKQRWEMSNLTDRIYGFGLVKDSFGRAKKNIWYSGKDGIHPIRALGWTALGFSTLAITGSVSAVARGIEGIVNLARKSIS